MTEKTFKEIYRLAIAATKPESIARRMIEGALGSLQWAKGAKPEERHQTMEGKPITPAVAKRRFASVFSEVLNLDVTYLGGDRWSVAEPTVADAPVVEAAPSFVGHGDFTTFDTDAPEAIARAIKAQRRHD